MHYCQQQPNRPVYSIIAIAIVIVCSFGFRGAVGQVFQGWHSRLAGLGNVHLEDRDSAFHRHGRVEFVFLTILTVLTSCLDSTPLGLVRFVMELSIDGGDGGKLLVGQFSQGVASVRPMRGRILGPATLTSHKTISVG